MSEKLQKVFAVGDIHGNYKGFKQVLERSGFDYDHDLLISLGDIADGYPEVPQCIEEFMKIKNLVWCLGNHDEWCQKWMAGKFDMSGVNEDGTYSAYSSSIHPDTDLWLSQGGRATFKAYVDLPVYITKHRNFWLNKPELYYVLKGREFAFFHAGYSQILGLEGTALKTPYHLYWDRNFWHAARERYLNKTPFKKIFLGHTSTTFWDSLEPLKGFDKTKETTVWNLDTGGGWKGKVTMMNIDTEEFFQSDLATELYPNHIPRK